MCESAPSSRDVRASASVERHGAHPLQYHRPMPRSPLPHLTRASLAALAALAVLAPRPAHAFWLLDFQTAQTLPQGAVGFIGGTGGQLTSVGQPGATSFTPFLAHFGIRVGLADWIDAGYRLCTVPLPYSSAGPTLGGELDVKLRLTPASWTWQAALIAGAGLAYLDLNDASRSAWAPGADLVVSRRLGAGPGAPELALNARWVYTGVLSAAGGAADNHVQASGVSAMLRIPLSAAIALQPEIGVFRFDGALAGHPANGWAMQYGAVLAARVR